MAPGGKSVLPTMWPLLSRLRERIDRRAARRGGRQPCGSSPSAATSSPKGRRAARWRRRSPDASRGKIVAIVSGGNIDLTKFASLSSAHVTIHVTQLPDRIKRLDELAYDLWWSWNTDARQRLPQPRLPAVAADRAQPGADAAADSARDARAGDCRIREWLANYDRASRGSTRRAPRSNTWCETECPELRGKSIAYFSAEFALHQSLPIYAGGLGVLAGDHCKEASDLGVPLIGVGFMYPQGYFHQGLSPDGWQQEIYERLNWKDAADRAGHHPGRQAGDHRRAARQPHGARRRVAGARRPREAVPARHRPRGERAVGSRAVGAALWRRPRDARAAGDHPRHRRRPRAQGDRPSAARSIT